MYCIEHSINTCKKIIYSINSIKNIESSDSREEIQFLSPQRNSHTHPIFTVIEATSEANGGTKNNQKNEMSEICIICVNATLGNIGTQICMGNSEEIYPKKTITVILYFTVWK